MTERNWRIVGLTERNTVVCKVDGLEPHDSGLMPSEFGTYGLSRAERGILGRGLTSAGNDKASPTGETSQVSATHADTLIKKELGDLF